MSESHPERVAIVGGGFTGVMTAVNLARLSRRPLSVTIINQIRPAARGIAYSTRRIEHLLNVAARNMSAFPELPDHFLQWLRTRSEYDVVPDIELRERFIPRLVYGDYLRSLMQQHLQSPPELALVRGTLLDAEAVGIVREKNITAVVLGDGTRVEAEHLVLATGNEPPAGFPGSEQLQNHPAWIGNPWQAWESRVPASGGTVVMLGTGLTTIDAIMTLRSMGWQGLVHAVSRNGWLPTSHFRGIEYPHFPPEGVDIATLGFNRLLALIKEHCERLRDMGENPAIIVDKMRAHTPRIWQNFTLEERKNFAKNHAARWNVLRHRIPPEIHAQVTTAQLTGQLRVHAANIESVTPEGNQLRVNLSGGKSLTGDLVVNATGPQTRFSATQSKLLSNLLRSGIISPDDMDMGVQINPDHTVVDGAGKRSNTILALGPVLRGTYWETIAVPELRVQARRVAQTILDQPGTAEMLEPTAAMEYMI